MDKEVLIRVSGLQMIGEDGQEEPVEILVPGEYYYKNGFHYLRYEEIIDETGEPTVNYVKMSPFSMEVRKKGLVNVHMVFERGKKNMAFYTTPLGTLQMGIAATNLTLQEEEKRLNVKVEYSLEMNNEHVADCSLEIQAQTKDGPAFEL